PGQLGTVHTQADGLRPGADAGEWAVGDRRSDGHTELYAAGAGGGQDERVGPDGRRVRPGRGAVLPADGPAAVSVGVIPGDADASAGAGAGASAAAECRGAARPGDGLSEVSGEGATATLPDGASAGRGVGAI